MVVPSGEAGNGWQDEYWRLCLQLPFGSRHLHVLEMHSVFSLSAPVKQGEPHTFPIKHVSAPRGCGKLASNGLCCSQVLCALSLQQHLFC